MTPHDDRAQAATTVLDRPWVRLAGWTVFLVLTLRLLHGGTFGSLSIPLGSLDQLAAWAERTSPVVLAVALVRLAALAAAWYLAAATLLTVAAALIRWQPLDSVAVRVSPQIVRRLVSRSASAGLAVGALLAAAPLPPRLAASAVTNGASPNQTLAAAPATHRPPADHDPRPAGTSPPPVGTPPTATMTRVPDQPAEPAEPAEPADPRPSAPVLPANGESWVVELGDSFWSIAEETLTARGPVSPGDISRYCDRLIRANRDRLVDRANPDLLVVGQELSIPPAP